MTNAHESQVSRYFSGTKVVDRAVIVGNRDSERAPRMMTVPEGQQGGKK